MKQKLPLLVSLSLSLLTGCLAVPVLAAPLNVSEALSRSHVFAHENFSAVGKRALVTVPSFSGDETAKRKLAVAAARIIANSAPAQFTCVFVRYGDTNSKSPYCEVIVSIRDITSLSVGTSRLDDILTQLSVVCVQSGETGSHILDQYLGAAEKQMNAGNFWEAEQIVDQGLASAGNNSGSTTGLNTAFDSGQGGALSNTINIGDNPGTNARYARDMLTLADNFDCWGDPDRAERILRQLIDHRLTVGTLNDADGSRSIQHLCDLLIADKRYQDAETFVRNLLSASITKETNPEAYAENIERLAQIHTAMGQFDQAASEYDEAIATIEKGNGGAYGSRLARCLEELADCQARQGKKVEARSTLLRARSIYDHAIVSRIASERIDYQVYNAHVKQIEEKLRRL